MGWFCMTYFTDVPINNNNTSLLLNMFDVDDWLIEPSFVNTEKLSIHRSSPLGSSMRLFNFVYESVVWFFFSVYTFSKYLKSHFLSIICQRFSLNFMNHPIVRVIQVSVYCDKMTMSNLTGHKRHELWKNRGDFLVH